MKCGDPAAVTYQKVRLCFEQHAYSQATVYRWYKDFSNGRTKVGDMFRGSNRLVRTADNIKKCAKILSGNHKQTVNQVARRAQMTYGSVLRIFHRDLELTKRASKLIPHQLSDRDRRLHLDFAKHLLDQYESDSRCIDWVCTTDKSWFYIWEPGSKISNMEWLQREEDHGQVVRLEQSVQKVMLIPFFDSQGLVHREYFHNQTISKEVLLPVMQHAWEAVRMNRSSDVWNNREEYWLHMDNAPAHCSKLVQDFLKAE